MFPERRVCRFASRACGNAGNGIRHCRRSDSDRRKRLSRRYLSCERSAFDLRAGSHLCWEIEPCQGLLEAVERLRQRVPGLVLHIAGSGAGDEADAIRKRIAAAENVVFHGQLNQTDLADLLRRSAVFVLPSFYEGLPLVLVEAAACGCRLAATALPGVVNQLQPQLGDSLELVSLPRLEDTDQPVAEDVPALVEELARAVEVSVKRPSRENASRLVHGMTWTAVFDRIETVWRQTTTRL